MTEDFYNNLSMTSKANVAVDPNISMKNLASEIQLAAETVGRAVKAVINAKIPSQHTNAPFD